MVTKLEKQFFDTFGIEPKNRFKGCKLGIKYYSEICDKPTCNGCDDEIRETEYPQITDHILLKLICIANSQNIGFEGDNIEDMKKDLLDNFIFFKRDVYDQIHNLFKEVK